ncbi:hypothetical protein ACP4OV_003841 [Aristida adscensionis]
MEGAISAVTGELVSRCISLLKRQYSRAASEQQKMERLQRLVLRVQTVIEEADCRHITNSGMVAQLQMLADAMYRGYHVAESFRCRALLEENPFMEEEEEVSDDQSPAAMSLATSLKRCRTVIFGSKNKASNLGLDDALERLEAAAAHIAEFVVLLGGCERILRRPYDAHLYADNFMFGRHAEKQKLLSFLLMQEQKHEGEGQLPVLPIIGGHAVGKKTLIAHVCNDSRVSSNFSAILHLRGDDLSRLEQHGRLMEGKTLVVVEFVSWVDEKDWARFYSSLSSMTKGSKVIILGRQRNLEKFGTVKPILLNTLPFEEFSYLFKILAFGSTNPVEHPKLVRIADDFAKELQSGWSLLTANVVADVMRPNLNACFWLWMLKRCRKVVERNISVFGKHPKILIEQGQPVDMTDFELSPVAPFHLFMSRKADVSVKELPKVTFEQLLVDLSSMKLLVDPSVRPRGEFNIITWESRIPPYSSFIAHHFVPRCDQVMPEDVPLSGRKRLRCACASLI